VVGGLVQFRRVKQLQLQSRLVWWSAVLFNLEDWKKRSFKVDWSGGRRGGLVQFRRVQKAQFQSRLVWWSVVLSNLEE
jgi:hypothetical protein